MKWYEIAILILLLPLGAYLREQTYRNVHGNATIVRDLSKLWQSLQESAPTAHGGAKGDL